VLGQSPDAGAVLPGQDAILAQRTSALGAAAVVSALSLPGSAGHALGAIPDGVVAVARPGSSLRFARLVPDPAERSVLASSLQSG
jgi:hypothetical protein